MLTCIAQDIQAQQIFHEDSVKRLVKNLPDITIVGRYSKSDYQAMPEIVGTSIYAGKKSALIVLDRVQGNVTTNTMRQVMAKIPGIHIWESDPSGIQIGIAARGLSPNRSWEFNIRQNGYDIAADPFGYPEAYYNPQLQAVQRIEVVRGQGSLQYGPQFGGLINYILRNGSEINKKFELETQLTTGTSSLFNSYIAAGGKSRKLHYYSFFDHRNGNGWRNNSRYYTNAGFTTVTWHFNPTLSLTAELMHSQIRSQQPGGLTDSAAMADGRSSQRSRNWFDIRWTTPALIINKTFGTNTRWNTKIFATIGNRNSVGFLQSILVKDSINSATGQFANRSVLKDAYRNYGMESRFITDFIIGSMRNTLSAGIRFYTGATARQADGKGSTGTDYDVNITGQFPRDIIFRSTNAAAFAEHIIRVTDKLMVIPGIRYEWLKGTAAGRNGFDNNNRPLMLQQIKRSRQFLLAGIAVTYQVTTSTEIYVNYAQAYRPIQFANLQAPPTTDVVDDNLKDSKGFNADLGFRGKLGSYLQFDISGFYLQYNNRIGTLTVSGSPSYRLITNAGNSTSKGFEGYLAANPIKAFSPNSAAELLIFGSYGYTNARYSGAYKDMAIKGKKLENAPEHIFRGGITGGYKTLLFTAQLSSVSSCFSDANNTVVPAANGNTGRLPGYSIIDLTASYLFLKKYSVKTGINNLANKKYFTRRAGGYPGPGALPGDGRTFFITASAKLF